MRKVALGILGTAAILTACSEPLNPTENVMAARQSVRGITATDLTFPGDGQAYDNNNRGEVVGEADIFGVWRRGEFQPLALPPEWDNTSQGAINSSGAIVGWSVREGQQGHAVLWDNGRLQDLGVLPGDVNSEAHAINARDDIVGVSRPEGADELNHAVLWRKGQLIALGTLPGDIGSEAWGIDDAGRIVGESRPQGSPSTWRPFMWKNGVMTELTELKQPNVGFTYLRDGIAAWKCPDAGSVPKSVRRVGVITYIPCPTNAAEQEVGDVIVDIEDVNSSGQAVGIVWSRGDNDSWQTHGYLWSGGERILLPPVPGHPDVGIEPHAINDRGEVVGHSSVGATLWKLR
jgi:probable HAF family extracellular repeat protein